VVTQEHRDGQLTCSGERRGLDWWRAEQRPAHQQPSWLVSTFASVYLLAFAIRSRARAAAPPYVAMFCQDDSYRRLCPMFLVHFLEAATVCASQRYPTSGTASSSVRCNSNTRYSWGYFAPNSPDTLLQTRFPEFSLVVATGILILQLQSLYSTKKMTSQRMGESLNKPTDS
jgi:hypothetical protein